MQGFLNIASDAALGTAASAPTVNLTFTGNSTLQPGASNISLNPNRSISIAAGVTATFDTINSGNTLTIPGSISGGDSNSAVNKVNPGTLVLTGSSGYAGGTTINAGMLSIGNPHSLGTGNVTLTGTAPTLQIQPAAGSSTSGFGGATNTGWKLNVGFEPGGHVAASVSSSNVLTLITPSTFENRSAIDTAPVTYSTGFDASFVYQNSSSTPGADGMAFVLENDPRGTSDVGAFGRGGLGYGPGGQTTGPITNSAALGWSIRNNPALTESTVVGGSAGNLSNTYTNTGSVNLASGDPILFNITGTGTSSALNVTLTDQTTSATYTGSVALTDTLKNLLGNAGSAFVGFTGSSTDTTSTETISNFSYITGFTGAFNANNNVTVSTNSTLDISYGGGASLGSLAIGSNTLTFTNNSVRWSPVDPRADEPCPEIPPLLQRRVSRSTWGALNDNGTPSTGHRGRWCKQWCDQSHQPGEQFRQRFAD